MLEYWPIRGGHRDTNPYLGVLILIGSNLRYGRYLPYLLTKVAYQVSWVALLAAGCTTDGNSKPVLRRVP